MLRPQEGPTDGGLQRPHLRSDAELMLRIQAGDMDAFGTLYDRHAGPVYALAHRMLRERPAAEDVVQEVFIGLWRSPESYQPERGRLPAWLLTITRNRSIDALRRRKPTAELSDEREPEAPERTDDEALQHLLAADVAAALRSLPADQREALVLAYFAGLTHSEIAGRLGIPLGTVKGRLRLGLRKLSSRMDPAPPTAVAVRS